MESKYDIQRQENSIDHAEMVLKNVLRQIRNDLKSYREEDIRNLERAILAVNKVTLRTDI